MRYTIVLPFITHRGGIQFLLELGGKLVGMGDSVVAVWPTRLHPLPGPLNEIEFLWRAPLKLVTSRWYETRAKVVPVPSLKARYIPDADVVIATAWQTASWVAAYPPSKGMKVYYIQEPEIHHDYEGCAASYRLQFDLRATISQWSADRLNELFGVVPDVITPEGIDHAKFPAREGPPPSRVTRVGIVYDRMPKKAFEDGYQAFLTVRESHPELELHLLGIPRRPPAFPPFVVPHFHISHEEKIRLFHSTQVWLAPSLEEGWGLVPMEAMACGNAVVTTRVGGTPYFAIHEETALVVEPGDRDGLARSLRRMIEDTPLRVALVQRGSTSVRRLTLEDTASQFRAAVIDKLRPAVNTPCDRAIGEP